ncbi:MAG: iron-containing alcohol dehydrogenase, partial [Spirochaetaceae bacterium]|nr:iron-containing alcohol dehydrogenase [Spirochaetaceae bacterium]
ILQKMAKYAAKEANPLYPVPVLLTAKELEKFYYKVGNL